MIRINLLPHREIRRRRQQQQFFVMLGVVVLVGAAIWFAVHNSLVANLETQAARNQYLESEIAKLDKEIEDIKKVKEMTAALLARKKVVESLQSDRSEAVHLLDALARELPDGVYLKAIKQEGSRVTITGYTQSQARVSTLMRNLEASPHLENANLIEIKLVAQAANRTNEFIMNVDIARAREEAGKSAKTASR